MSRNPFSHPEPPLDEPLPVQRLSALAVSSLVFGILCCIPGSGLIALILGIAGLIGIARSGGRRSGRGFAVAGIILGLLGTVVWTGLVLGGLYGLNQFTVYERVVEAAEKGDRAGVRAMLSPRAAGALSDRQIDEFGSRVAGEYGQARGLPQGVPEWFTDYPDAIDRLERAGVHIQRGTRRLPLPIKSDRGVAPAVFELAGPSAGPSGAAVVDNVGVVARDGSIIWLLDPKAAAPPGPAPGPGAPPTAPSGAAPGAGGETGQSG